MFVKLGIANNNHINARKSGTARGPRGSDQGPAEELPSGKALGTLMGRDVHTAVHPTHSDRALIDQGGIKESSASWADLGARASGAWHTRAHHAAHAAPAAHTAQAAHRASRPLWLVERLESLQKLKLATAGPGH